MDAAKHVRWYVMNAYQNMLTELLQLSENVLGQANAVSVDMKENEAGQLETLLSLYEQRQLVITELNSYIQETEFRWTDEDREVIRQLKTYEDMLQPLMNGLYQSFLTQINRVNQTKQASKKFGNTYQQPLTDGSFFDQRK